MAGFLERIAKKLYSENGSELRSHCLVFPNRRAGLFFVKYLAAEIDKPVWTPAIFTINELFHSLSELQPAENEILLFELFRSYRSINKSTSSGFDEFYFWGDMLLNDFDDVDKYLVDANLIFRNVQDIKKIDREFGGLTSAQIEIIKRFWINFNPEKPTDEKSGFISLWSVLPEIYSSFRKALRVKHIGFEGMIFRDVIEDFNPDNDVFKRLKMFHFIGFNAINECERNLMDRFKRDGMARFYWDYDNSYIRPGNPNSAGYFIKDNLKIFGNDMPEDWSYDTLLSTGSGLVKRRVIETSSDIAQVKLIPELISELSLSPENAYNTAIVLADENLLLPVLTSLPVKEADVNITMGYPLKHSDVYTLVKNLIDLQKNSVVKNGNLYFSYSDVLNILKNSLLILLHGKSLNEKTNEIVRSGMLWVQSAFFSDSEELLNIFRKPPTPLQLSEYFRDILTSIAGQEETDTSDETVSVLRKDIRNEFIFRIVLILNRLDSVTGQDDVIFTTDTWIRLFDRILKMQSVPFSGEPLSGIQIMGILETRALDFKNIIMLSVNEGSLPAASSASSFIPFGIREAFGLPSVNHQESVYAYHFYRLLQRADNVTFIFNSNPEGLRTGEMSRFLLQMKYDPQLRPDFLSLGLEIKTHASIGEVLERTEEHSRQLSVQFLDEKKNRILSPSAINTWLNCRMKFYYRYVNRLTESDKISADIDAAMIGNLLHGILRDLYNPYIGQTLTGELIRSFSLNRQLIEGVTENVFRSEFNRQDEGLISGNELLAREVIKSYLFRIIETDIASSPFTILNIEDTFSFGLNIPAGGAGCRINIGGKIDRVDKKEGIIRIVDYKTGTVADSIKSIESLFEEDRRKELDGWLQVLIYCEAFLAVRGTSVVRPSIYRIRKLPGDGSTDLLRIKKDRSNEIRVDDYMMVRESFMEGLTIIADTIFNNNEPFVMTTDQWNKCSYCPYKKLCLR